MKKFGGLGLWLVLTLLARARAEDLAKPLPQDWDYVPAMKKVAAKFHGRPGVVLHIGDSITYANPYGQWARSGQGQTAEDRAVLAWMHAGAHNDTDGWWLASFDHPYRGRSYTACSGIRIDEMLAGSKSHMPPLRQLLETYRPEMVILMLGTNDASAGRPVAAYTADVAQAVDLMLSQGIICILSTIPPHPGQPALARSYNEALRRLARDKGLPLIDFEREILRRRPNDWNGTLLGKNDVHPTAGTGDINAASAPTPANLRSSGYLLRGWLSVKKIEEVKRQVLDTAPDQKETAGSGKAAAGKGLRVIETRCEYLDNPLGIDVLRPRLTWKLQSVDPEARGERQTAYHVLVAWEEETLTRHQGDLWDSGVVESDQSVLVPYDGQGLDSGMMCFWQVQVRDQRGVWSDWSRPAHWIMGMLHPEDWRGEWIGTGDAFVRQKGWPPPDNSMPDPWFRNDFTLDAEPTRAYLFVASVGFHEVWINGRQVPNIVLAPCVTDLSHRARYCTYDISAYLRPGKNVIGFWLGTSWSIFPKYQTKDKPAAPLVLAQAAIIMPDNHNGIFVTGEHWKTHPSPNRLLGVWDFMHYGGELYDANQEIPNWSSPDFDDSDWKLAKVFHPHLELSAQMVEPNRLVSALQPVAVEPLGKDVYRVDMGRNFAGWVEVDVRGQPGARIDLEFSERKDEAMTHRLHSAYIIGPKGQGTFRNHFNYSVGRWITIRGLDHPPKAAEVRGYLVRTGYERAGHFACSNPLLNRIYETTLWTFENLSLGGYVVDCPHRERMGYGGDAHATILAGLANYHLGALYTTWAQDWRDVQEKDGNLPYTAPTYWGGGGPAWCGFCITMPWEVYERCGDRRILEENFPTMQAWLRFLETKSRKDMLVRWGGEWDFLGDWLWPGAEGVNGDTRETLFFNNCYWIFNLETAARVADVLGQKETAAGYRRRAEQVRQAVHQTFYNTQDSSYVNGQEAYLAIALLVDLPPEQDRPAVWKRLEQEILVHRQGHIWAGITGGAMLFRALQRADRPDLVLPMALKEDYPGWGDMLRQRATTFWESWEGKLSLLHSSYLYIGGWFHEGLAGIRPSPAAPGFQHFVIKPGVFARDSVSWVRASYDSLYGEIRSDWQLKDGKLRLEVAVPVNTTATVYVPATAPSSVTEGDQPLKKAAGVKLVGEDMGFVRVEVGSGRYTFVSPEPFAVAPGRVPSP